MRYFMLFTIGVLAFHILLAAFAGMMWVQDEAGGSKFRHARKIVTCDILPFTFCSAEAERVVQTYTYTLDDKVSHWSATICPGGTRPPVHLSDLSGMVGSAW